MLISIVSLQNNYEYNAVIYEIYQYTKINKCKSHKSIWEINHWVTLFKHNFELWKKLGKAIKYGVHYTRKIFEMDLKTWLYYNLNKSSINTYI